MILTIKIRTEGKVAILCLAGSLTVNNVRSLHKSIQEQMKDGSDSFCLDLSALDHCDKSGIGELIKLYSSIRNRGNLARFREMISSIRELLQVARLWNAFNSKPPMPGYEINRKARTRI